jgi:hypothetical protein
VHWLRDCFARPIVTSGADWQDKTGFARQRTARLDKYFNHIMVRILIALGAPNLLAK